MFRPSHSPAIGFFCGSSQDVSEIFHAEMRALVEGLAHLQPEIVYGGGGHGLMGTLARSARNKNLRTVGVLPTIFDRPDVRLEGLTENILVPDLFERKRTMIARSDAFIVFPGGIGTMDEALEVLCLKQIGQLDQPIYFFNVLDYWTTFFAFLDELAQQRMVGRDFASLYKVFAEIPTLVEDISNNFNREYLGRA